MDDLILDTANDCTAETAQADKVKISAYQWRASKLKPKVYGDRRQDDKNEDRELTIKIVGGAAGVRVRLPFSRARTWHQKAAGASTCCCRSFGG